MLPPPPGLHPPDFSKWSLPLPEAPVTGGLPTPLGGLPGIGRQTVGPWALGQKAPAPLMQAPSTLRECCWFISQDHSSLLHLPSRLHSHRASPLPHMSSQYSHRASLLQCTSRPCSRQGGQQEGDCWLNLLQTELLLPLTLPTRTEEGNRPRDGASEAGQLVAPDGDEG